MSKIYSSAVIIVISQLVNFFGLPFTTDDVATIASFVVSLGASLYIAYLRHQNGDITVLGARKN